MDASPSIAPALMAPLAPNVSSATPPWEIEPRVEPLRGSPEVRPAASRSGRRGEASDRIDRLHWGVIALTVATAVLLVFGTRADGNSPSRVVTWSASQPG